MNVSDIIQLVTKTYDQFSAIIDVFLVVFVTLLLHFLQTLIFNRILKRLQNTPSLWDALIFEALSKPLGMLIWLLGLTFASQIVQATAKTPELFAWIEPLRTVGIIAIFTWFTLNIVKLAEEALGLDKRYKNIDIHTSRAIGKIIRLAIFITAALIVLQSLGIPISGLLAFGGAGTVVVGLASKDLLSNFFGALTIYLDRPFAVGDWIKSPDREIEGTVEEIGWRITRIRTFDKRPLYIPNSMFTTIAIENPSRMENRRIKTLVGVRYDDALVVPKITNGIKEMLGKHADIDHNKVYFVNLVNFGPSSLDILVYCFTKTTNWVEFQAVQERVFMEIINIISENGAEIAFPTQTLHVDAQMMMPQEQNS